MARHSWLASSPRTSRMAEERLKSQPLDVPQGDLAQPRRQRLKLRVNPGVMGSDHRSHGPPRFAGASCDSWPPRAALGRRACAALDCGRGGCPPPVPPDDAYVTPGPAFARFCRSAQGHRLAAVPPRRAAVLDFLRVPTGRPVGDRRPSHGRERVASAAASPAVTLFRSRRPRRRSAWSVLAGTGPCRFTRDLDMAEGEDDPATAVVGQRLLPSRCLLGLRRWVLESLWDTGWATDR